MVDTMDTVQAAIAYIDRRLATIDRGPGTWGSPESLELQTLLLFEIRTFLLRRRTYTKNPYEARFAFLRFIRGYIPDATAQMMAAQIPHDRVEEELPKLLGTFRDEVALRIPPEDPFETNELVLELTFAARPDGIVPFQYFIAFHLAIEIVYLTTPLPTPSPNLPIPEFRWLGGEDSPTAAFFVNGIQHPENLRIALQLLSKPRTPVVQKEVDNLRGFQSQIGIKLARIGGTVMHGKPLSIKPSRSQESSAGEFGSQDSVLRERPPAAMKNVLSSRRASTAVLSRFPTLENCEQALHA